MPSRVSGTQQEFSKQFKVEATALKTSFSNLDDFQQNQREAVNFLMINHHRLILSVCRVLHHATV